MILPILLEERNADEVLKVAVQESVAGVWSLVGSKTRLPCRYQLTNIHQLAMAGHLPKDTNEYVHYSVRVLREHHTVKTCKALDPFRWDSTGETLKLKDPPTELLSRVKLEQDQISDFEAARSPQWLRPETYPPFVDSKTKAARFEWNFRGVQLVNIARETTAAISTSQGTPREDSH